MALRVLIADDHPLLRHGLRAVLEAAGIEVVAEAADGRETLAAIRAVDPHVAIVDLSMPDVDGLEILAQARTWPRAPRFVVLTMHEEYAPKALALGAKGYVLKDDATREIVDCVRTVARGDRYLSRALGPTGEPTPTVALATLTDTERRVLRLVGQHKTSREIAELLSVSHRTVQNHRANMCKKLGLEGSQALLRFALDHGANLDA
ncbi:MAG: response regulator transcription factor [Myxococcales bacterium]|nr:response regulator transcription factor [Myxococcales bacterium]